MSYLKEFLSLAVLGVLIENFVLVKFYGICPFLGVSKKTDTALGMGMAVTFVMVLASLLTWLVQHYILVPLNVEYLQTISFILLIAALVQFVEMVVAKLVPSLYNALGIYLPLITTNCAVLGVTLINVQREYSLFQTLSFSFWSAMGFTLAIFLFAGVRERLETSNIPKHLKGFPIALVTASLIAMAFLGFQGLSF
ncbi:MAG: electron transport complex subunit RsxA [Ruminococcaceae bacterium]|nr:electron transport complex subunit RsxA [Oscillospiraceae bacterium]